MPDLTATEVTALNTKQHTVTLMVSVRVNDHEPVAKECGVRIAADTYERLVDSGLLWTKIGDLGNRVMADAIEEAKTLLCLT